MGEMLLNGRLYGASGIRELTQAQYDALPASKLTDGVLYCIKDTGIVEGDKYAPVIYSLEEREIGVWTDGKPLYQKTVVIPISSQTGDITLEIATGINVCNVFGIIKTSGGFEMALPASYSNIFYCGLQHDGNYVRLSIYSTSSWQQYNTLTEAIVTIQYTKTTDIPGSGTWGTDGVPMVHYDGTERIIGTWFGETLYEKTIDCGSLPNSTYKDVSTGLNVGTKIRNAFGYSHNPTSGVTVILSYMAVDGLSNSIPFVAVNNGQYIRISTGIDRTAFTETYVTIQYTKTT